MSFVPFQEGAFQNNVFQTLDDTQALAAFQSNVFAGLAFADIDNTTFNDAFEAAAFQGNAFQIGASPQSPPVTTSIETIYFMRHKLRR